MLFFTTFSCLHLLFFFWKVTHLTPSKGGDGLSGGELGTWYC